jgi:hypothetical protein
MKQAAGETSPPVFFCLQKFRPLNERPVMSDIDVPDDSNAPRDRDGLRRKALQHQTEKDNRKAVIFEEMQTERVMSDAKTAKLRALRLAKEQADAATAQAKPVTPKKKRPIVINTN